MQTGCLATSHCLPASEEARPVGFGVTCGFSPYAAQVPFKNLIKGKKSAFDRPAGSKVINRGLTERQHEDVFW